MTLHVNVADTVSPAFDEAFYDVMEHKYTHYVTDGGRGSTKSSFVSEMIPLLLMQNINYNAVVLRKVANTLKKSVYNQVLWAIDTLQIRHLFKVTISPLEITYIATGQKIVFLGCDDPTKVKSIKFERGYAAIVWYEELDQFSGMEEIRNINQSLLRGGDKFWAFYSYNPPRSKNNWVNEEMLIDKENRKVYHSNYLSVPREWLGELFFIEAEQLKATKLLAYEHEYMGVATGTGGSVFDNVTLREITDEEIKLMDKFYYACDFGFSVDPAAWGKSYVHHNKLYIIDEIYEIKLSNSQLARKIKAKGVTNEPVIFDSSEPKSIQEMRELGITALGAKKGPDSIDFGMKYLQSLDEIIIDKRRCPNAAREFVGYEYEMNKNGQFISKYPDKDNHFIDQERYALEWFTQQKRGSLDYSR